MQKPQERPAPLLGMANIPGHGALRYRKADRETVRLAIISVYAYLRNHSSEA
ncbi:Uncharacterised protein [Rikenella microfusus]|uniref:Uncharacterized protein n=1 Tax=Rikenella microfusus TaxID=28139 RepID=A0A379MTN1_9BACT|nr:Uncharacterised protein [Rikenella microfusus]